MSRGHLIKIYMFVHDGAPDVGADYICRPARSSDFIRHRMHASNVGLPAPGLFSNERVKPLTCSFCSRVLRVALLVGMAKGDGNAMDVSGLAGDWEANASVRKSARDTGLLMRVPNGAALCESSRPNAVANADVLIPCLERMASNDLKLPYMTPLQDEVEIFFRQVHVKVSEKIAYRTAGELKKMLSFIKRKANKKEVTKDTCVLCVFL